MSHLAQSNELIDYLTNPDAAPKRKAEPYGDFPGSESVLILHDDTFHEAISTHSNLLVMFYAPGKRLRFAAFPIFLSG